MQPRGQFNTGVDAGRNDAVLKRAEPGRPGRLPPLAALLLAAFAAILPLQAQAQTAGICGRTAAVRSTILGKISGVTDCANVTETHLAAINQVVLPQGSTTALAAGDFDGLTSLTQLFIYRNILTTLPAGVFDDLTSLTYLQLAGDSLTALPAGVFDNLTSLTQLELWGNKLATLPDGVFDNLTSLTELQLLNNNLLTTLPAGVFDSLTSLTRLRLNNNGLTILSAGVFDNLTALDASGYVRQRSGNASRRRVRGTHRADESVSASESGGALLAHRGALPDDGTVPVAGGTVTLDGSGSGGPWGTNVTYSWALTAPTSGVTVTFDDAASATPVVTIPALVAGTELTFTLTVTARADVYTAPNDTATLTVVETNAEPSFTSPASFDAAENQTAVGTVQASDGDSDDSVTGYAIEGGADASKFSIVASTGVVTFASAPNFENAMDADADNAYEVVVRATSGTGARVKTADQTITVTVTDVEGEAPGVPAAPTVASASVTSVTASWVPPANAGPPITDYDYQYRVKTPQGSWTEVTNTPITAPAATITQLADGTEYEVQVRATNDEGTSDWSGSGSGSTDANASPSFTSSGDVRRGGEPDRGGDGSGFGQRHGRQRDGLCDPWRRGCLEVLYRPRNWCPDVRFGA